ncbi:MAG: type II toxin-antitoxin system VapC family toxin [Chloroflexi bacterium]|nr:type II toxin-antitoxin system VapC family toxin [Chloroflexota bacterium]
MRFLLDTNICIYIIRRKPAHLFNRLTQYAPSDIGISAITVAELYLGVHKSSQPFRNQQALDQFLIPLTVVDFDMDAAITYGHLRADIEVQGAPIGSLDMLIAAQALSRSLTLVTHNTREFERVPDLIVEDWVIGDFSNGKEEPGQGED